MADVKLKCSCGKVQGVATNVSPSNGNRIVCCCSDCQAFIKMVHELLQFTHWQCLKCKNAVLRYYSQLYGCWRAAQPSPWSDFSVCTNPRCTKKSDSSLFRLPTSCRKIPVWHHVQDHNQNARLEVSRHG